VTVSVSGWTPRSMTLVGSYSLVSWVRFSFSTRSLMGEEWLLPVRWFRILCDGNGTFNHHL